VFLCFCGLTVILIFIHVFILEKLKPDIRNSSLHHSTPSLLVPFLSVLPLPTPPIALAAISAIRPFLTAVAPFNPSSSLYSAFSVTYNFTLGGTVTGVTLALSTSGIDIAKGLLNIPQEAGYRAFDAFYYLLNSASTQAEREYLNLKDASAYRLLNKSNTFAPPSYLPTADDAASAEDFRLSLKAIGIKGTSQRNLISVLAGLLKLGDTLGFLVDQEELEAVCEDAGGLLGIDPAILLKNCTTEDRDVLLCGIYEALVEWVIVRANEAIGHEIRASQEQELGGSLDGEDSNDTVSLTIIDIPNSALGKAVSLRGVFDDSLGINAEMREDGLEIIAAGSSVINEMHAAVAQVEADIGISGTVSREREVVATKKLEVLEKVAIELEMGTFLRSILFPVDTEGITVGRRGRFDLSATLGSSRVWYQLALHPTDDSPATLAALPGTPAWSAGVVSRQLREWRLPEWANRRHKRLDFTADFDIDEFVTRYSRLGCKEGKDGVESWILERGWSNGEVVIGHERIWMREGAWWEAETMLDLKPEANPFMMPVNPFESGYSSTGPNPSGSGFFSPLGNDTTSLLGAGDQLGRPVTIVPSVRGGARSIAPTAGRTMRSTKGDYGLGPKGDDRVYETPVFDGDLGRYAGQLDTEFGDPKHVEKKKITPGRRLWTTFVWALTFWIPSPLLRYIGRMKRPDIRMAWREKLVLCLLILLFNAVVVFYIVEFGNLLCPNKNKVWNSQEVSYHTGDNDFYVSIHGNVYDISSFWRLQHSDKVGAPTSASNMEQFAGENLDAYFPPPLTQACQPFVTEQSIYLQNNNSAADADPIAVHSSGPFFQPGKTKLNQTTWYSDIFLPQIQQYYKGKLVWTTDTVTAQANDDQRYWSIIDNNIYDLTNYFYTMKLENDIDTYDFLPSAVTNLFQTYPGQDITDKWQQSVDFDNALNCLNNVFYVGIVDFRDSPKCTVNNWILLSFTILICAVILVKFLAALQLGSKRRPAPQDKFVICQVPAYTEGEDQLRKALDSLTALQYDNKRKLICVICDGMIVGRGNDRPTPKIILDILGVDPKIDPPALPFKSVGQGSEQLNYGKVYSGLYEYEGNVVPYIVIVKVGKESEQNKSKPGNRGKRDSQVLLLSFLSRVHHRAPMSPLELEIFHQINNVIGVDPELYEYLLMVDADTSVREDSLNRLVAACANDAKVAGICGETSLQNEERSWWTMIQVYEYYISHHLAKAFESLFGSVTCLPGW
jgi:chitin synthase